MNARVAMLRCGCFVGRFARRGVAVPLLFVLTALHPLLHPFEGGALDALIQTLTVWALVGED